MAEASGEVLDAPVAPVEAGEIGVQAADEIVVLYCSYKQENQTGDDTVEIVKGDQATFRLGNNQWKKMTRNVAQWYVGKSSRWDVTQPLKLSIKTLEEVEAIKKAFRDKKAAQADSDAQAAKAAAAAAKQLEVDTLAAAKLRQGLVDKAVLAGAISAPEDAESMTNDDLAAAAKKAK